MLVGCNSAEGRRSATADSGARDTAAPVSTSIVRGWSFTFSSTRYGGEDEVSLTTNKDSSTDSSADSAESSGCVVGSSGKGAGSVVDYRRNQGTSESISDYLANLRRLASRCKFGTFLPEALRDRLVCGMQSESTQKVLLTKANLTLEKALEISQGMEAATIKSKELKGSQPSSSVLAFQHRFNTETPILLHLAYTFGIHLYSIVLAMSAWINCMPVFLACL